MHALIHVSFTFVYGGTVPGSRDYFLFCRCVRKYEGHVNRSHPVGVAWSPCAKYFAVGSEDKSVSFWSHNRNAFMGQIFFENLTKDQCTVQELQLSLAFDRQLSSTLIDFELVEILIRVDESLCAFYQSTLINSHLV